MFVNSTSLIVMKIDSFSYMPSFDFKVTGYSLGRVPCSKRDNLQCSFAPDYGYKGWSTDREVPRAYTQSKGIGYFVGTVCRGRSNFVNS